jgi:hypothetical protein
MGAAALGLYREVQQVSAVSAIEAGVSTFRVLFTAVLVMLWVYAIFTLGTVFGLVFVPAVVLGLLAAAGAYRLWWSSRHKVTNRDLHRTGAVSNTTA